MNRAGATTWTARPTTWLAAGFTGRHGSLNLVLRPVGDQAVLLEAVELATASPEDAAALPTLAWHLQGISLARDPADGEVCARLLLPVDREIGVTPASLSAAMGILLPAADLVRPVLTLVQEGVTVEDALARVVAEAQGRQGEGEQEGQEIREKGEKAWQRAQALLARLAATEDQPTFLLDNLEEFDDEVLAALMALVERAREAGETGFAEGVAAVVAVVQSLRLEQNPAARAQVERVRRLLAAKTSEGVVALVEAWPEALSRETLALLDNLAQAAQQAGQAEAAAQTAQVRGWLEELRAKHPLLTAVLDFVGTGRWDEARELARENPLLHGEEALTRLDDLAAKADARGKGRLAQNYRRHRERLKRWQETGFAAEREIAVPEDVRSLLEELMQLPQTVAAASRRIALCRRALSIVTHEDHSLLWAAFQVELANGLSRTAESERAENLEEAIRHYELALAEAASSLPADVRERLAGLAGDVAPTVDALAVVGFRMQTELLGQPAFTEAKQAWHTLLPERYGLHLDEKNKTVSNPEWQPSIGPEPLMPPESISLEDLALWTGQALRDPQTFAGQTGRLERLARLVRQHWPRGKIANLLQDGS